MYLTAERFLTQQYFNIYLVTKGNEENTAHLQITEEVSHLGMNVGLLLPPDHIGQGADVGLVDAGHQHGIYSVQVTDEIPEAGLASESAVNEHVETVDAWKMMIKIIIIINNCPNRTDKSLYSDSCLRSIII